MLMFRRVRLTESTEEQEHRAADIVEETRTSSDLDERPFLIDGIALDEAQVRSLSSLVAGNARRGDHRGPYTLPEAIDVWRRHNCVVTEATGRKRWRIHSASPTFREEVEPTPFRTGEEPCGEFLAEAGAQGAEWSVVLIREGWSLNGRYYPRQVLEAAIPLFEGAAIAQYEWSPEQRTAPHLPGAIRRAGNGGPALNTIGLSRDVYGALGPDGRYELRATFVCTDAAARARFVETHQRGALCSGGRDLFGLSIDAEGDCEPYVGDGRRGQIVRAIHVVHETTIVSNPAAGGRFERLVAGPENQEEESQMKNLRKFLRARRVKNADTLEGQSLAEAAMKEMSDSAVIGFVKKMIEKGDTETALELLDQMAGASEPEVEEAPPALDPMFAEAQRKLAESQERAEKVVREAEERVRKFECAANLKAALLESGLPAVVQEKVRKRFADRVFEAAELTEAIADFREALAVNAGGAAQVQQSTPRVEVLVEQADKIRAGVDLIFGYEPEKDESLNESQKALYRSVRTGRRSIRRFAEAWHGVNDYLDLGNRRAGVGSLQEATTADFTNVLSTSMEKALIQKYREFPRMLDDVVGVNDNVDTFKTQDRILWGGFAGLPGVTESDSSDNYSNLGFPREEKQTYSVSTKGGMVTITRAMLINDDMQALRDLPNRIASGARHQENLFRFNLLIGNAGGGGINTDNAYDGVDIYHANHRNYATTALSYSALIAARRQIQNQYGFGVSTTMNDSGGIIDSDVAVTVASTAGMFAGQYIQIEAEIIKIAAITSSTVLDITGGRGALGTTAAAHADTTRVYQLTAPIPLSRLVLVHPYELEATAMEVLGAERVPGSANNDLNFLKAEMTSGRLVPLAVPALYLGGDTNNWFLAAPYADIPSIEMAYLNNRQEPEILVQDSPTEGNVFTRDNIRFKIRHEYGGAVVDYRGLQGNIVA